jgi:hypothetical protein
MKALKQTALALTLSLMAATPVFASQAESHSVKHTGMLQQLEHQQQRIHQGVKHKQLTRKEEKSLMQEQRQVRQLAKQFYKDGRLSKHERQILEHRLHRHDRDIKRFRHNEMTRYVRYHDAYAHGDHCRL